MKNLALVFFLLMMLINCDKNDTQPCEDIMKKTDNNLSDAKENLCGKWKLTDYISFRSIGGDPNLQIEFSKGKGDNVYMAAVSENGAFIGSFPFTVSESINIDNLNVLKLTTEKSMKYTNGRANFLFGEMRICKNRLLIDNGIILDGEGFIFDKE
jgi:hypothetical protein